MLENHWPPVAADLLKLVEIVKPNHVVVDIQMTPAQPIEGPEVARRRPRQNFGDGTVEFSITVDASDMAEAFRRDAGDGWPRDGVPEIESKQPESMLGVRHSSDPMAGLTKRELEVLRLMAQGLSNAGIGRKLWIAESTVEKHVRNVMSRLQIDQTEEHHRRVMAVLTFLDRDAVTG